MEETKGHHLVTNPHHDRRLAFTVKQFVNNESYSDVCFVGKNGFKVLAHKLVLSAASTQMKQMFLGLPNCLDMITVHLPDVEGELIGILLDFLYEGQAKVSKDQFNNFKSLTEMLGIKKVDSETETIHPVIQSPQQLPPQTHQIQQPQLIYMPASSTSNTLGPDQYISVLAAQPQISQHPLVINQNAGQLVQKVQQRQILQPVQSNHEVLSINNQMMAAGQIFENQIVQCSTQMVTPNSQVASQHSQMISSGHIASSNDHQLINNQVLNQIVPSSQPQFVLAQSNQPQYILSTAPNHMMSNSGMSQNVAKTHSSPQPAPHQNQNTMRMRRQQRISMPIAQSRGGVGTRQHSCKPFPRPIMQQQQPVSNKIRRK